jgi:branched-chain amino acid transport system permease protein
MLVIMAMAILAALAVKHSKYGLALRSIGDEEEAAAHLGINVNAVKIVVFAITSSWIGAAGAISVTQYSYVDTSTAFDVVYSFTPTLMALFGGIGQITGWILGAVFFTLIAEMLLTEFPYYYMLIFGIVIISVLLFFPSGLVGMILKVREKSPVE